MTKPTVIFMNGDRVFESDGREVQEMSTIGSSGLKGVDMKLASLGNMQINVTKTSDPEILDVVIVAENRETDLFNRTNKDETTDQFVQRLKGMLRALMNEPVREMHREVKTEKKKPSFEEQKMKHPFALDVEK